VKRYSSFFIFFLCLAFSVAAFYNVSHDNAEVERMAKEVACGPQGKDCRAAMTRLERRPWGQTFEMSTPKRLVDVICRREFVMVGEYHCALR
jgi:hypothetical protein